MRQVTQQTGNALKQGQSKTVGNTRTDGRHYFLHGNHIAEYSRDNVTGNPILYLSDAGWRTNTTKERLNGLLELFGIPARLFQKNFTWHIFWYETKQTEEWTGKRFFGLKEDK